MPVSIVDPQIFISNPKLSARFKPQIFIGDEPKIFNRERPTHFHWSHKIFIEDPKLFFGDPKLLPRDSRFPIETHRFLLETLSFSSKTQDFRGETPDFYWRPWAFLLRPKICREKPQDVHWRPNDDDFILDSYIDLFKKNDKWKFMGHKHVITAANKYLKFKL